MKKDTPLIPIPPNSLCQEASMYSTNKYIPCGVPATTIVFHDRDNRGYFMCDGCADHNCRNRGGKLVTISPKSIFAK
jgi:hypothetical protein